nr:MAG TPA: hypothetical protein [Caudoviricetes sp.]
MMYILIKMINFVISYFLTRSNRIIYFYSKTFLCWFYTILFVSSCSFFLQIYHSFSIL